MLHEATKPILIGYVFSGLRDSNRSGNDSIKALTLNYAPRSRQHVRCLIVQFGHFRASTHSFMSVRTTFPL